MAKLNLWSLLLSNKIVVDTCKKIPIDIAFNSSLYTITSGLFKENQLPSGVILANKKRKESIVTSGYFALMKKKESIIAIGILCTNTPISILEFSAIGKPSNKAWLERLIKRSQGKLFWFECI